MKDISTTDGCLYQHLRFVTRLRRDRRDRRRVLVASSAPTPAIGVVRIRSTGGTRTTGTRRRATSDDVHEEE